MKRVIILIFFWCIPLFGQTYSGNSAFLHRGMSARALSLGGAYTAVVNDASAVYWNPAGIIGKSLFSLQISDMKELTFYTSFSDVNYPQAALTYSPQVPLFTYYKVGIGVGYSGFSVKEIDRYDTQANYLDSFDFYEQAFFVSLAIEIQRFRIGVSWKVIQQNFGGLTRQVKLNQSPKGADIGLQYSPWNFLTVGLIVRESLTVENFEKTPQETVFGMAIKLSRIRVAADYELSSSYFNRIHSGVEVLLGRDNQWRTAFGVRDYLVDSRIEIKGFEKMNTKLNIGGGYTWNIINKKRKLRVDVALQQSIYPEFLSPYSRSLMTTITFF